MEGNKMKAQVKVILVSICWFYNSPCAQRLHQACVRCRGYSRCGLRKRSIESRTPNLRSNKKTGSPRRKSRPKKEEMKNTLVYAKGVPNFPRGSFLHEKASRVNLLPCHQSRRFQVSGLAGNTVFLMGNSAGLLIFCVKRRLSASR
ncbi:hypothetical protein LDFHOB_08220 [Candidatus Electronema aureum]